MIAVIDQIQTALRSYNPLSIRQLMSMLDTSYGIHEMRRLIREYIPDYEQEILSATDPLGAFKRRWEDNCFGLYDMMWDANEYEMFDSFIPVELMGFGYEDYHEMPSSWKDEFTALFSLYECPIEDEARIPLLEKAAEIIGPKLIARIPENGYGITELRRWLNGTDYEPVALIGEWLWGRTDNFFWDYSHWSDDGTVYEGTWDNPDEIQGLIDDWGPAMEIRDKINNFLDWVSEDIKSRMESILTAIDQAKEKDAGQLSLLADLLKDEDDPHQELTQV